MALKDRLAKLEQKVTTQYDVLYLPDGSEVRFTIEDVLEALAAVIDKEDHWLLPVIRRAGASEGLPGLVNALSTSRERVEKGGANGSVA